MSIENLLDQFREEDGRDTAISNNATQAYKVNPDQYAEQNKLARQAGVSPALMPELTDDAKLKVLINRFHEVAQKSPKTAAFLTDPENAKLAHDDTDNAQRIEGLFGYLNLAKQSLKNALPMAGKGLNELGYNLTLFSGGQALARAFGDEDPGKLWTDRMAHFQRQIDANSPVKPASKGQELFSMATDSVAANAVTLPLGLAGKAPLLFGFAATAPGQLDEYLKAGYSPAQSAYFSLSNKAMEGLTELIGVQHLYRAGKPLGKKLAGFMLGDLFGEEINTAYSALMDKGTLKPDMTLADFGQRVIDTAIVTAAAGGMQGAMLHPVAKLSQEYQRNQQAALNKDFMLALGEAAGESKLRQRLPEKFQELVSRLKEGGEIENVYIPGDQWKQYWQEQGMDPAQMADDTFEGGSAQYTEALAAGGDIVIPIEVYAGRLAATEHHAGLLEHSRLRPGDATSFEAAQFEADQVQMLADLKAEAETALTERPSHYRVYDDIFGQLQGIGYDRQTAEQYATIAAVRAKQRAAVLGVDAFELYNESPLKIVRPLPEGVQRQSVDLGIDPLIDRLRAGDIPTDESVFGQSLLQFVRERGVRDDRGDLKSMEVDAARLPGKKNIIRKDGMDLDKVREAAVESGYLPEGATTADLLDMIDQELRGTPVYSQQVQNPQGHETKLALEELRQHLDQVGINYNQLSNEQIRRELYQVQGGNLYQSVDTLSSGDTIESRKQKYDPNQLSFDFREGTTNEEKHQAARLAETPGRLRLRGNRTSVLANAISAEFRKKGSFNFIGQKITSAEDVAAIAQVYRNPSFETLRYFFTKNNVVVGHTGVTSRLPGVALGFPSNKPSLTSWIKSEMTAFGADGFWMQHNHPSGNVQVSSNDIDITRNIAATFPEFLGHVIINHNKYGFIDQDIKAGIKEVIFNNEENGIHKPSVPSPIIGKKINSPGDIVSTAYQLQIKDGHFLIIAQRGTAGIGGLLEVPVNTPKASIAKIIRKFGLQTGSSQMFAILPEDAARGVSPDKVKELRGWAVTAVNKGFLVDAMDEDGFSAASSGARGNGKYFGKDIKGYRVAEERPEYPQDPNILFQSAFHGSPHTFDKFSLSAIGTGEGAQAYGYGLYFAGNKEVAEYYKKALAEDKTRYEKDGVGVSFDSLRRSIVDEIYSKSEITKNESIKIGYDIADGIQSGDSLKDFKRFIEKSDWNVNVKEAHLVGIKKAEEYKRIEHKGRLYAVELAPKKDEYLLWDKPLEEQPEKIKKAVLAWAEESKQESITDLKRQESMWPGQGAQKEIDRITAMFPEEYIDELAGEGFTGEDLYHDLTSTKNSDKAASDYLHSLGIRGIKYLDGSTRNNTRWTAKHPQGGISDFPDETSAQKFVEKNPEYELIPPKQNFNYVIFSEDDIEIKEFWQKQQNVKRGFFRTSPDMTAREIGILKDADLSTFVHELGHSWLEELKQDATRPDAPEQLKNDWATVARWLGSTGGDITREQHEQFARAGESYLMEGKAPSAELQPIFQRFRSWLTSIYKTLTSLNVKLNDDVRGVFDRLLASEAEIKGARQAQNLVELFATKDDAGMTEAEFSAYRKQAEAAHLSEVEKLNARLMKEKAREQAQWWKDAREELRAEVEAEAQAAPAYRAIRLLSTGKMFDGSEGPALKLDRAALVKIYGGPFLKRLPRGFGHIYANEGGQHPDAVASLFGYDSGDAMIKEMIEAPPIKSYIEGETDIRMRQQHGDMMLDGTLADEALAVIHGDLRGDVLAAELRAIKRQQKINKPALDAQKAEERQGRDEMNAALPDRETFKMAAAQIIGAKKIGDLSPRLYLEAERRAGKKAFDAVAKKDWQAAGEEKQKQLLNHYLFREATTAQEQIDGIMKEYDKLKRADAKIAKVRDMDLVNAARAILARYGIDNNGMDAAAALAQIQAYNPETYQDLSAAVDAATQNPKPFKQLTMDEFLAVNDAVMNLWHLALRTKQIEIDGRIMNRDEVVDELNARIEELGLPVNQAGKTKAVTKWEKFSAALVGVRAATTRVEAWVDAMDGGKPGGVFRRYLWNPVIDGVNQYRTAKKEFINKYLELLKPVEAGITHDKIAAPELNYTFNGKQELLGALLHTGNESNLEKLLVGRQWGYIAEDGGIYTGTWDAFINRMIAEGKLTQADYDFIQGVWDLLEEAKPLSQKAHHEMYGYYFSEITANPVNTPFGTYRGGYAPAIVDSDINQDQASRQEKEALESTNNSFMFPSTGRGFTKSRVTYNKQLVLDLRLVPSALDKVLRFSFIEPRVKDVGRVVVNPAFREVLNQFNAAAGGDMLIPWLQRTARQTVSTASTGTAGRALDTVFQTVRRNTGIQMMVANVSNTIQQFTGLALAATKVKPTHLKSALWRYVQQPMVTAEAVAGLSEFMATNTGLSAYDMQQQAEDILLNPSVYEKVKDFSTKNGYILQQITQHSVNVVTWCGAYDQAVAEGENNRDAVRRADSAVRMTQGTFNAEDVSRLETGSPFVRAFTQFYTYFNMQANLLGSTAIGAIREGGVTGAAPTLLKLYAAFAVAAIMSEAVTMAAKGGPDPDDDELDIALQLLIMSQVRTGLAMVPFVGQLVNLTINQTDDKRYNDRLSTAPFVSQIEATFRAPVSIYDYALDDGSLRMAVKDTLAAIGLTTGLPAGALGRPLGYLAGMADGKYEPSGALDMTRGLVTGAASK